MTNLHFKLLLIDSLVSKTLKFSLIVFKFTKKLQRYGKLQFIDRFHGSRVGGGGGGFPGVKLLGSFKKNVS